MRIIKINTESGKSKLIFGVPAGEVQAYLPDARIFIITDTNVRNLYGNIFPEGVVLKVTPGEQSKSLEVVEDLCKKLLEAGTDRKSFILGYGGGVVCDLAGVVASLYMRGVRHGFVSTTLLSQVDASIGGKNGVNLGVYKNIIGTFKQPEFVICDQKMLSTLSDEEYLSGIGELIKHGIIADRELFFNISDNLDRLLDRDPSYLEQVIMKSVRIKAHIVRRDPHERGHRMLLNFGHTFGHPIETTSGILHGIAVMMGMLTAAELSVWTGELPVSEQRIIEKVLTRLGVNGRFDLPHDILELISKDKKSSTGYVNAVVLRSVGKALVRKISLSEIDQFIKNRNAI